MLGMSKRPNQWMSLPISSNEEDGQLIANVGNEFRPNQWMSLPISSNEEDGQLIAKCWE